MLDAVITHDIDMLHRRAGKQELVEVHGSIASCVGLSCGARGAAAVLALLDETVVPTCVCGRR